MLVSRTLSIVFAILIASTQTGYGATGTIQEIFEDSKAPVTDDIADRQIGRKEADNASDGALTTRRPSNQETNPEEATQPILLIIPAEKDPIFSEAGEEASFEPLAVDAPDTITVSFEGSGSGEETCSGDWGYQKITYTQEITFEVTGTLASQTETTVTYELTRQIGTIHFYGTLEDSFYGETTTMNFDRTQNIEIEDGSGTLEYSTTQCNDIYIGFPIPSSSSLPYSIYIQYSGLLGLVRNTVNMPYPWDAGTGCLSNNYDVTGSDDYSCEMPPDDVDNGECQECPCISHQGNPIGIYNGNKYDTAEDLRFGSPFRGNLTFQRSYNGRLESSGPVGYGWTHSYSANLVTGYDSDPAMLKILDETGRGVYFVEQALNVYQGRFDERSWVEKVTSGTTEYIWYRLDRKRFIFNSDGQLIRIEDEVGNRQELAYNSTGLVGTVTDVASGRTLTFSYSGGLLQNITGPVTAAVPSGIWVEYVYDANQNLISVTYPDGSGLNYNYEDPADPHNMTEKRDMVDHFLAGWSYDGQDRAVTNTTRDGRGVTVDYDTYAGDSRVAVTDAYGENRLYTVSSASGRKRITGKEGLQCQNCSDDVVRMAYDDESRMTEKEYANGRIDLFQDFDSNGNPQTVVLASGSPQERIVNYTYSQHNLMLTRSEASVLGNGNKETIWDYDDDYDATPNENPTTLLSLRIEKGYTHDSIGTVVPYEYSTTYEYQSAPNSDDPRGLLTRVDGPRPGSGDLVTYTYHAGTGDLASITQAEVGTTSYDAYDAAGNTGMVTDINGVPTTYVYDGRNRVLTTTANGSFMRSTSYTTAGEIDVVTDETGRMLDYDYDSLDGLLQRITDPSGNYLQYAYDSFGNRIEDLAFDATDTLHRYQRFDYQGDGTSHHPPGKLWKVINRNHEDTADVEIVYGYDLMGNLETMIDANGKQTSYDYDLFNRLASVTQPGNVITQYGYDSHGNLISVMNAENQETRYTYDDMGRLLKTVSPDTGTTTYSYDEAGDLVTKTPNNGVMATYVYDDLNRLIEISYADSSENVTYTYDAFQPGVNYGKGRLTGITDPSGSYAYTYDEQGNQTSETKTIDGSVYTTGYSYDDAGRVRGITYPSGRAVTYAPDVTDAALVKSVTSSVNASLQTVADSISYQPFGPLKSLRFGNHIDLAHTYDLNYGIATIAAGGIQNLDYLIGDAGNIILISDLIDPSKDRTFAYDDLYRLTGLNGEKNFTYDDIGNRLTKTMDGQSDTYHYFVNGTNQTNILESITGDNPEIFSHDENGNITGIGAMTLEYSPQTNRLIAITGDADYTYNTNGQRVKKVADGITTIFHYDLAGNLIGETTSDRSIKRDYVYLGKQRVAVAVDYAGDIDGDKVIDGADLAIFVSHYGPGCIGLACDSDFNEDGSVDAADLAVFVGSLGHSSEEHYYFHNDHLGTPLKMTSETGGLLWEANYSPFGGAAFSVDVLANNFRFAGQYYDNESGLHYNYHRYYDPVAGRYLTPDPIGLDGGINLYSYVENNSVNSIDPLGLRLRSRCESYDQCMNRCLNLLLEDPILGGLRAITKPLSISAYEAIKGTGDHSGGLIRPALSYGKTTWDVFDAVKNYQKGVESMAPEFVKTRGWVVRAGDVLGDNYPHVFAKDLLVIKKPGLGKIVRVGLKGVMKGLAIGEAISWSFELGVYRYPCHQECKE